MLPLVVTAIALLFMLAASIYDLKYGEIPDKINYGLTLAILAIAGIFSLLNEEINPIVNSLLIGIAYFTIAYVIHRIGQWGGGDVKLLLGVGCALGLLNALGFEWNAPLTPYYLVYFIDMGVIVLPYALLYMLVLSLRKPEVYGKFLSALKKEKTFILLLPVFVVPLALYLYTAFPLFIFFSIIMPLFVLASIFLKLSEQVLLTKTIAVSQLKEYDALAEDLIHEGRKIAHRRHIEGLSKEQVDLIKKMAVESKIPWQINIRWGVKFAPIILAAFLLTVYVGDLMALIIRAMTQYL